MIRDHKLNVLAHADPFIYISGKKLNRVEPLINRHLHVASVSGHKSACLGRCLLVKVRLYIVHLMTYNIANTPQDTS